jgi:hypothetical protein
MESAETISLEYKELLEGLDFILEHFPKYEPLFPRNIMTKVLADLGKGQSTVYDKGTMISHFEGARRRDCRIGAYLKYDDLIKKGLLPPTYKPKPTQLFIDLDLSSFGKDNRHELDAALYDTLNNIKQHLNGAIPTVLWTGGGYHVYLPLDTDFVPVYEELPEFQRFKDDKISPSVKFIRYAAKRLTNSKSDKNHNPSFDSCLWRTPGSINTKYTDEDAKVRIIQRWNGVRARPTKDFMITDFHAFLVQEVINEKVKELERTERIKKSGHSFRNNPGSIPETYRYIEDKLLKTPIEDYRKHVVDVILIPYFVVIKGMTDFNQIFDIIMQWLDKCAQLRRLNPSRHDFVNRVRQRINEVMEDHSKDEAIAPMRFETLKEKNPNLYKTLKLDKNA